MAHEPRVAPAPGPRWLHVVAAAAGAIYLASIFLGSAGSSLPDRLLPRPARFFTQVACLFPHAAPYTFEYRVTAFSCRQRQFRELDHRPHFPIHPDDKENRFERLGHFYRRTRVVMRALDDYLVGRHNEIVARGATPGDGIDGPIGGIMVLSLRIPLPEPGTRVPRYSRRPLAEVPVGWRKPWYKTALDVHEERCAAVEP